MMNIKEKAKLSMDEQDARAVSNRDRSWFEWLRSFFATEVRLVIDEGDGAYFRLHMNFRWHFVPAVGDHIQINVGVHDGESRNGFMRYVVNRRCWMPNTETVLLVVTILPD